MHPSGSTWRAARLGRRALQTVYYKALLRYIGCNVETHLLAAIVGDEIALRADFAAIDNGNDREVLQLMARAIQWAGAGASPLQLASDLLRGLIRLPGVRASFSGHCEVAQRLALRLGFDSDVITALGQLYERWDGKGAPHGLRGDAVAPAVLVVTLAQDALVHYRLGGVEAAVAIVRKRAGSAYAPHIAECFITHAPVLLADLDTDAAWELVLALEPCSPRLLSEPQLDLACRAMADFVDIKSAFTRTHSAGVAALASAAARQAGLSDHGVSLVERAGLVHDLGRTAVSITIWEKPGALTSREWEQVRMHPYHTERVLAHSPTLARLGAIAGLHHERLDSTGYHRGIPGALQPPAVRILAAADVYQALCEARPHRQAVLPEQTMATVRQEVRAGRLDPDAVSCVLAAAGHTGRPIRRESVAGLTEREVEVLRLIARGASTRQIATQLVISPKTADHHIQHTYGKLGVSTRAGATLFAMEHDLLARPID